MYARLLLIALGLVIGSAAGSASAQQMGKDAYNFPTRNAAFSVQYQLQARVQTAAEENAAAGLNALHQFMTTYSSQSTSIGNMNTITQILSGGAQGNITPNSTQTATGNQGATATTDTNVKQTLNGVPVLPTDTTGTTQAPGTTTVAANATTNATN